MKSDAVRILSGTNTQTRNLKILSYILKLLNKQILPLGIIQQQTENWSKELEKTSFHYKNSTGKLTEGGKATKAFPYYIELLSSIGLITRINQLIRCTKYGLVFNLLHSKLNMEEVDSSKLLRFEILFFFHFLFSYDADSLVTLLKIINGNNDCITEKFARSVYAIEMKERLRIKSLVSSGVTQLKSAKLFRDFELRATFKKNTAFKHHVPNRLRWMSDLGLLNKSGSFFFLSSQGKETYKGLEIIDKSGVKDIDEDWLFNNCWDSFSFDILQAQGDKYDTVQILGELFTDFFDYFGDDGSFRISLYPVYLYISIYLLSNKGINVSFNNLLNLVNDFTVSEKNKKFSIKVSPRLTESYINITII